MSIESFHHALHGAGDAEPMFAKLRAITKIEDPALMLAADKDFMLGVWATWNQSAQTSSGLS